MTVRLLQFADLESVYDHPERAGRLAGLLRERNGEDAIVAGTGDDTAPGVLSLATEGRVALSLFDRVEPAAETLGNHDLDYGLPAARSVMADAPQPWICANVAGGDLPLSSHIIVTANDIDVGITGVTSPRTPQITPPAADLTVGDPVAACQSALATLRDADVDVTVVLAHLRQVRELATAIDVDVILAGHVHEPLATDVNGTTITRPGAGGELVYELAVDPADGDTEVTRHRVETAPVDHQLESTLRERASAEGINEPIGRVEKPIERAREDTRFGESRIGNLIAEAYRWGTGADIAIQNAGGIRTGPPLAGAVTKGDLMGIIPFDEEIALLELDGATIETVLTEGSGANLPAGGDDWWNAHISGARLTFDTDSQTVTSLEIDNKPVKADREYLVACPEYLLRTDLEFPTLRPEHLTGHGDLQYEILIDYATEVGIDPVIDGRLTGVLD